MSSPVSSRGLFCKGTNLMRQGLALDLITSSKSCLQTASHWDWVSAWEVRTNTRSVAFPFPARLWAHSHPTRFPPLSQPSSWWILPGHQGQRRGVCSAKPRAADWGGESICPARLPTLLWGSLENALAPPAPGRAASHGSAPAAVVVRTQAAQSDGPAPVATEIGSGMGL